MPIGTPVDLDIIQFDDKKEAKGFFKGMLQRYRKNQDVLGKDGDILRQLIERHPERDEKVGVGIAGFFVREPPSTFHQKGGQKCFWLRRTDGTEAKFSYITCVDAKPRLQQTQVMDAMRAYVDTEIEQAKRQLFKKLQNDNNQIQCPISGKWISYKETEADHKAPRTFEEIADIFIIQNGLTWDSVPLTENDDHRSLPEFTDPALVLRWQEHHRSLANGRIMLISKEVNRQESNRHRLRISEKQQKYCLYLKK